jgi:alkylation response protein AidB-like acyl-CoA dehydrogenase
MRFELTELTAEECALQAEVREFLAVELPQGSFEPSAGLAARSDPEFSKKLAVRKWVGMALPAKYGGGQRSPVERFVVAEELLRWGAPVGYHWIADRQSGPLIARFGNEAQRQHFLPAICRAELSFCIGMSEADSGSDLASVRSRAVQVPGGWSVNGTKIWTSGARYHEWMIALVRTSDEAERHAGLTQMIIDLRGPGITINPIVFLDGTADFNEVVLTNVFIPEDHVVGSVGSGWSQIGSELASERSGPDRWLSTYMLVEQYLREHGNVLGDPGRELLGTSVAHWWSLRHLSMAIARAVERGESLASEAALVKEYGTRFEQDVLAAVRHNLDLEPSPTSPSLFERLLAGAILTGPSFTIRGGTVEILRSVAAKGLRG